MGKNKKRKQVTTPVSASTSLSTQSSSTNIEPLPGTSQQTQVLNPGVSGSFVSHLGPVSGQKRKHSILSAGASSSSSEDETNVPTSLNASFQDFLKSSGPKVQGNLRNIVIDGSNVAMDHGQNAVFSTKGIELVINFFKLRGHKVLAFLPSYRSKIITPKNKPPTQDFSLLQELYAQRYVVYTPTRVSKNKMVIPYDDIFLLKYASKTGAVVVSNDNYRDLEDSPDLQEVISKRILMFCFVGNLFMPAEDPLGRNGPKLNDFLSISNQELEALKKKEEEYEKSSKDARVCTEEPPHQAPTLLSSLANLTITEGEAIEMSVDVSGNPPPSIVWSVEKILENDEKCCLSFDGRKASCIIQQASKNDEGTYKLKIKNSLGEISSKVNVHVIQKQ